LNIESKAIRRKRLACLDILVLFAGLAFLAILIVTSSRANIVADSVDYYAILQWMTPAQEKPIVRNLHFAEQRSPGYSLTALIPYGLLTLTVEPFVSTEKVVDMDSAPLHPPPPIRMRDDRRGPPFSPAGPGGSEFRLIPPQPLLLQDVPFKDFYVPQEDSWFQWKLFLALAVTSYSLLFLGMAANAWILRLRFPAFPGYALIPLAVFSSVIFMHNILRTPLYATLTAYGFSSLFALFFVKSTSESHKSRDMFLAGVFLGFLVLTRLETGVIAAVFRNTSSRQERMAHGRQDYSWLQFVHDSLVCVQLGTIWNTCSPWYPQGRYQSISFPGRLYN